MTPEKKFENAIIAALKEKKIYARHFNTIGQDGWPDILAIKKNKVLLIECKYNTMALRSDQKAFHSYLIREYGITNIVQVCDMEDHYIMRLHDSLGSCVGGYSFDTLPELIVNLEARIENP